MGLMFKQILFTHIYDDDIEGSVYNNVIIIIRTIIIITLL